MSKTKEDSWENILKKHFNDDVYKKFRKFYTDDFLEKEYNHWKKDFCSSKEMFIESYTSPSGEWLYAPDLPDYNSKTFVCDKNHDPLADGTTIFPGTGNPFQIFRAKEPTNDWEKLFPNFIVKDAYTSSIVLKDDPIKDAISRIFESLASTMFKNIKALFEKGLTMEGVNLDTQQQAINSIIYLADHGKNKKAADLLKLFLDNKTFKEALEPSCLTKLIARESVITETDLPPGGIAIIGEYLLETSDSV